MKDFIIYDDKVIFRTDGNVISSPETILDTEIFREVFFRFTSHLKERGSSLLDIFGGVDEDKMILILKALSKEKKENLPQFSKYLKDVYSLRQFVEELYNFWRSHERYIVCYSSPSQDHERIPDRTFTSTISHLNTLVRSLYRNISDNIVGSQERIYRDVPAAFQVGIIAKDSKNLFFDKNYSKLNKVHIIRQIFTVPPLILDPPRNKRDGFFEETKENLLEKIEMEGDEYLCYPVKVSDLVIHVYFHIKFIDLGISMANLFDLASDEDLLRKPDAVYIYGVKDSYMSHLDNKTVYYDDKKEGLLSAFVPLDETYGYFGYVKKMVLTLHNILMMRRGRLPIHGAMVSIKFRNKKTANIVIVGDSGAGKSESLEALRVIGDDYISDMKMIFYFIWSNEIDKGYIKAYGTETGAFVRLDDLSPEFAYGNLDRSIIMSPQKINARALIPITTMREVLFGHKVDIILYANNYEEDGKLIEFFPSPESAKQIFREGKRMAKGTTTESGITKSYYANPFGPHQRKEEHDIIADRFFCEFEKKGVKVGILRTKLGISGMEKKGPEDAARALFEYIMKS